MDTLEALAEIYADELVRDSHGTLIEGNIAVVRTSDRGTYLRCRRRWGWSSHLRHNLEPLSLAAPLWFGQGFHFAMEDLHGEQKYGSREYAPETGITNTGGYRASKALCEFVKATHTRDKTRLPDEWQELTRMGIAMLDYYQDVWLDYRNPLKTFVYNGEPQVEVNFRFPIPFDASQWGYDQVIYSGTLDRISIDDNGGLWIIEYKTAKAIQRLHYTLDAQIGTYIWAARQLYPGHHIMGVIYQQHLKDYPEGPRLLQSGTISTAKNQRTSHALYRATLVTLYGDNNSRWPSDNVSFLNSLAKRESAEDLYAFDCFIRRDAIERNEFAGQAEGEKILMQTAEMLNPDTPMYPHPTRDCFPMCPFYAPCVAMDSGDDWEALLQNNFREREATYDSWRDWLPGGTNG